MKKILKLFLFLIIIILVIKLLSFNQNSYHSKESDITIRFPSLSKFDSECCMYSVTFKNLRTIKSINSEFKKLFSDYEKVTCDNKDYYYNEKDNYTIIDYGVKNKIINEFYITYTKGNICKYEYKNKYPIIENIKIDYTIEEAINDGYYVKTEKKEYNKKMYDEFMSNVENNKPAFLRIISLTIEGDIIITDIDYNEKFSIVVDSTRDRNGSKIYKRYQYDNIAIYKNSLYAFNGEKITDDILKNNQYLILFSVD